MFVQSRAVHVHTAEEVSHYAPPRTDDRRFPSHVPIDSRIRCAPADAKEVSSCVVLYNVDAG
ncbi:hypothetical protein DPMN_120747 [Dreissena polymorpha]|uniref:Uncharacterized protein n=1 Tax=Dreissena polymorpha TaxID=45954 RepID=A0A9D4GS65_DREPO|nr:hypothetical protein DPMN_120747 [Dreissena polymorpha]